MRTLEIDVGDIRPVSVAFTADELVVTLADGRRIATPLAWYPRLRDASPSARANLELMAMGIHWPELDEDLGIAGMLQGRPAARGLPLTRRCAPSSPRLTGRLFSLKGQAQDLENDCYRPAEQQHPVHRGHWPN
jgi:Protein of unknown function (DUF2442)